ncbi:MAG: phosphatidate cytidylyltransferase [Candidatus Pelagibacter sp.]
MSKKHKYHLFGYIILCISFYCVFGLRNNFGDESLALFLLVLLTCIFTDLGGYLFGNIFKGPKITSISPNKTYSGMIGSYVFSFVIIIFFFKYSNLLFDVSFKWTIETCMFIFLISTVSQIGDLIMSYFKRLSKIKDTGKIIPGHGGILDRIDGMIFAFPFSYVVLNFYNLIY